MCSRLWRIQVPKERIVTLIDAMDADDDGYLSLGEVRDLLKEYAKHVKQSMRWSR